MKTTYPNTLTITLTLAATLGLASCDKNMDADAPATPEAPGSAETPEAPGSAETAETPTGTADYPLDYCVVSGEPLGSMGEPVVINHEGTTVKFCCKACLPEFNKNPEAYLSKLEE